MKAASFEYLRAASLLEAAQLLKERGEGAQILAGGQSLIPAMSFRLSRPMTLVDINCADDAVPLTESDEQLRCGALVRHAELERSPLVRRAAPLLAMAMPHIAHIAIRNRGTPCGSVALADPSAEIPACAVALGAQIVLQGPLHRRMVPAESFFRGLYDTDRQPDEVITELRFPVARLSQRFGFHELSRRHGDFALAGAAVVVDLDEEVVKSLRLVMFACEPSPRLSVAAAALAVGRRWSELPIQEIAAAAVAELDPMENSDGDATTKRAQAGAIVRRTLRQMLEVEGR